MQWTPLSALFTLVASLVVAGLVAWVRQARLEVLLPRLFAHSLLSVRGHLAELTVFNRGWKTEETVELALSSSLKYEIVGTSTEDVSLTNNKVSIQRIGPGDEVSLLLLVEGGDFSTSSITNCLSKESKGRVVTKLSDITPTGPQRVGIVAGLVILLVLAYFMFDLVTSRPSDFKVPSAGAPETARQTQQVKDWNIANAYRNEPLFKYFSDGQIQIAISRLERRGDITSVHLRLVNNTSTFVEFTVRMTTAAGRGKIALSEQSLSELWLAPSRMSEKTIKVVIPATTSDPSDKLIIMSAFLSSPVGSTLKLDRVYQAFD
jgi:hypothetical protein